MKKIIYNNYMFLSKAIKYEPLYMIIKFFLACLSSFRNTFLSIYVMKFVINQVELNKSIDRIVCFLSISLIIISISYILEQFLSQIYLRSAKERISQKFQKEIFDKILTIDYINYNNKTLYDQILLVGEECNSRIISVVDNFFSLVGNIISITSISAIILNLDAVMIIVCILSFIITYVSNMKLSRINVTYDNEMILLNKESEAIKRIIFLPEHAKDVRTTNILELLNKRIVNNNNSKKDIIKRNGKLNFAWKTINSITSEAILLDLLLPLYLIIKICLYNDILLGSFVALINASYQLKYKLEAIVVDCSGFNSNGLFIERYVDFTKMKNTNSNKDILEDSDLNKFQNLYLRNVCFSYPNSSFILNNINLSIRRGERIAIVGENGSGKSTLINVLINLYAIDSGEIFINTHNAKNIPFDKYNTLFSVLTQDFQIYATTISQNISMDTVTNYDRLVYSSLKTGFNNILEITNRNYQSSLTKEFSNDGINLSGGESQRLALSRCFYNNNDILVLDEPTSSLDIRQEQLFYELIKNLSRDKTIIFVSHRLSSIKVCDKIIYMENGKIAETGTHNELYSAKGKYYKMFKTQEDALDGVL